MKMDEIQLLLVGLYIKMITNLHIIKFFYIMIAMKM